MESHCDSFEVIKYHGQIYLTNITLCMEELLTLFNVKQISDQLDFSIRIEYSYGKRKFDSILIEKYQKIKVAQKDWCF